MKNNTFTNLLNAVKQKISPSNANTSPVQQSKPTEVVATQTPTYSVTVGQLTNALHYTSNKLVKLGMKTNINVDGISGVQHMLDNKDSWNVDPKLSVSITLTDPANDNQMYEADFITFSTSLPSDKDLLKYGFTKFYGPAPDVYDHTVLCVAPDYNLPIKIDKKTISASESLTKAFEYIHECEKANDSIESEM